MRKAKIICTLGPSSSSKTVVDKIVKSGMDVARLNFSHGTHEEHEKLVDHIRQSSHKFNSPVAILQDLRGLKIRIGSIRGDALLLKKGSMVTITARKFQSGDDEIPVPYPKLISDVDVGSPVLIDDGLLQLKVTRKENNALKARVIEGGIVKERKGVNLPGTKISGSTFTKKDQEDLKFGIKIGVDYVAMSFVHSKEDILRVKKWIKQYNSEIPVIAKIETRHALENIDEIIQESDGVMVARGDLGVEVPLETVPLIQKELIAKCNVAMKPVITATQMLESMKEHMSPTRAEVTDVANAVLDGSDALMLSAETSIGKYPVQAVRMMDRIIRVSESHPYRHLSSEIVSGNYAQALAESACSSAKDLGARTIVAFSRSGFTALLVSKFRPAVPITGFTVSEEIRRRMNLYWGITPFVMKFPHNTDEMINESEKELRQRKLARKDDSIVIIASSPFTLGGKSNIMKLHKVGY